MLPEQRQRSILDLLAAQGAASVRDLQRHLNVSQETIRRDMAVLAERSQLRRTHGGAIAMAFAEPEIGERLVANAQEKRAIGKAAAELVPEKASVILDCGSTVQCVAEALAVRQQLTVITNDLTICGKLARRNDIEVHLLGGRIQSHEHATIGPDAIAMLRQYRADYAFIGAGAISDDPWLMDYSRDASELRQMMLQAARNTVIVADHSKFGGLAPVRVDDFRRVTHLVTDATVEASRLSAFEALSVQLVIAEG